MESVCLLGNPIMQHIMFVCHHQQEGRLCAVHCLNNLLQGSYFTAVDLGNLADQLDEAELRQMAEGGFDGEDYRRFVAVSAG